MPSDGVCETWLKDDEKVAILSDIQGMEDHLGDMDFKVAGTEHGITAIQMDIKIAGIDKEILTQALSQARVGRLHILNEMKKCNVFLCEEFLEIFCLEKREMMTNPLCRRERFRTCVNPR